MDMTGEALTYSSERCEVLPEAGETGKSETPLDGDSEVSKVVIGAQLSGFRSVDRKSGEIALQGPLLSYSNQFFLLQRAIKMTPGSSKLTRKQGNTSIYQHSYF